LAVDSAVFVLIVRAVYRVLCTFFTFVNFGNKVKKYTLKTEKSHAFM